MPKKFTEYERVVIKDRILKVGKNQFSEKGLRGAKITDITKEVGISTGSFYNFYTKKEDLYFDIFTQQQPILRERVTRRFHEESLTADIPNTDKIKNLFLIWIEEIKLDPIVSIIFSGFDNVTFIKFLRNTYKNKKVKERDIQYLQYLKDEFENNGLEILLDSQKLTDLFYSIVSLAISVDSVFPVDENPLEFFIESLARNLVKN